MKILVELEFKEVHPHPVVIENVAATIERDLCFAEGYDHQSFGTDEVSPVGGGTLKLVKVKVLEVV